MSPEIDVTGQTENSVEVLFDASWRPESNQRAWNDVKYDGGAWTEVFEISSDETDPDYLADIPEGQELLASLNNPSGASTAQFCFGYQGNNNWWFAVDEIFVETGSSTLLSEDWDSVELQPNVDEGTGQDFGKAWTHTAPEG